VQISHLQNQILALEGKNREIQSEAKAQLNTLQSQVAALEERNRALQSETEAQVNTLQNQIAALEEKNKVLQSQAKALERQKEEERLEMKSTYEALLEDMKTEIDKGKITITQLRGKLKVNMLDEILFDSGKTTIKPQGVEVLERVGNILLTVKDRAINIEGHTDGVPIGAELSKKYPTNWELSAARASNVARYLQEKSGINPSLLSATGYGEYQPVASNKSKEGRAKNRRIEIVLVPREIVPVSRK
jgi:chemotaxis protein MotB